MGKRWAWIQILTLPFSTCVWLWASPLTFQDSVYLYVKWGYGAMPSRVILVVKNLLANEGDVRDMGSIPGSGRSPGGGHGHLLQHSYLENPLDSGAWWATVHRVEKSQTQWKRLSLQAHKM